MICLWQHLWTDFTQIFEYAPISLPFFLKNITEIWQEAGEKVGDGIGKVHEMGLKLKVIVHPKIKILSSFTHPQVVPTLYAFLCSAEHKGRYSEECGKQSSSGALFSYYGNQWCPKTAWLQTFFQIIFLCFRQNKEIHTGLELLEVE